MPYSDYPSPPASPRGFTMAMDREERKQTRQSTNKDQIYPSPPLTDEDQEEGGYTSPSRKRPPVRSYAQSFSGSPPFGASPAVQALTSIPLSRSKSAGMGNILGGSLAIPNRNSQVQQQTFPEMPKNRRRASAGAAGAVRFGPSQHSHPQSPSLSNNEEPSRNSESNVRPVARTSNDRLTADSQLEAKVVILGSQGVGKTTMVHRYTTGQFSNSLTSTIGASFLTKKIVMPECRVRLQLWDTAGQERFRSMAPIYYRGSQAAVIVYDITNLDSFYDVRLWLDELRNNMNGQLIVHVVGAKSDLVRHRAVTADFARKSVKGWMLHASAAAAQQEQLANFASEQGQSRVPTEKPKSLAISSLGGLRGSSRRHTEEAVSVEDTAPPAWCEWELSEVSAKDDSGIEDLFLQITSRLVSRKLQIERERFARSRDSVMLSSGNNEAQTQAGWACCA